MYHGNNNFLIKVEEITMPCSARAIKLAKSYFNTGFLALVVRLIESIIVHQSIYFNLDRQKKKLQYLRTVCNN